MYVGWVEVSESSQIAALLEEIEGLRESRRKTRRTSYRRKAAIKDLERAIERRNARIRNLEAKVKRAFTAGVRWREKRTTTGGRAEPPISKACIRAAFYRDGFDTKGDYYD